MVDGTQHATLDTTDLHKAGYISDTEPADLRNGILWFDTSGAGIVLKVYVEATASWDTVGTVTNLASLGDVNFTAIADGDLIQWDDANAEFVNIPSSTFVANPLTTEDDLIVAGVSGVAARLAKGTDGQVLTVDPTTHHLVWATPGATGYSGVQDEGSDLTARAKINFVGRGIIADDSTVTRVRVFDPKTMLYIADEFMGGGTSTTSLGQLGWTQVGSGAVNARQAGEANHPGIIQFKTQAIASSIMALELCSVLPADFFDLIWLVRLNTNDANTTARIGIGDTFNGTPLNGVYIEKLTTDTDWFLVTQAGGSGNRSASLGAVTTDWLAVQIRRVDASTVGVRLATTIGGLAGATEVTATLTIPTVAIKPGLGIATSAAAAKTIDLDYFDMIMTGLTR